MRPISELSDLTARWSGVLRWRPKYRLALKDDLFATLDWETASGSVAVARWQGRVAVIERGDFSDSRVVMRDDACGPELGTYVADWREGGRLTLRSGRTWAMEPLAGSPAHWSVADLERRSALDLRVDTMTLLAGGSLSVARASADLPELGLLVVLSWYVAVQAIDHAVMLPSLVARN